MQISICMRVLALPIAMERIRGLLRWMMALSVIWQLPRKSLLLLIAVLQRLRQDGLRLLILLLVSGFSILFYPLDGEGWKETKRKIAEKHAEKEANFKQNVEN